MTAARLSIWFFAQRVLVAVGVGLAAVGIIYFIAAAGYGLLIIFGGVLFAVLLNGLARLLYLRTSVSPNWALVIAVIAIVVVLAGASSLGGIRVAQQTPQLNRQISKSLNQLHRKLMSTELGRKALETAQKTTQPDSGSSGASSDTLSFGATIVGHVRGFVEITIAAVTYAFVAIIVGLYLAAAPGFYIRSFTRLLPPPRQPRCLELFEALGHALRRWLAGRFCSMVLVGVLTTLGLTWIGIPLALLLGLIAGALTFVPYLGAIVSAVPALLIALLQSPQQTLYVGALYLVAHIIEGYVFSPLIQRRVVHLAPAFLIAAQLLGGLLAGILGIILAAPAVVAITVAVQMLYLQDVLHERPHVLGE